MFIPVLSHHFILVLIPPIYPTALNYIAMPLWQIYHPANTFIDDSSKREFAQDITKMYAELGLPAFYVVSHFYRVEDSNVFVGGESNAPEKAPFVRIVITHIAIHVPDSDSMYLRTTSRLDQVMKAHIADKGYDFEYHVDETDRRLWKINGMIPPQWKSEEEKIWVKNNRAIPYKGAYPPAPTQASI